MSTIGENESSVDPVIDSEFLKDICQVLCRYDTITGKEKSAILALLKTYPQTGYIYCIWCKVNSRAYVGQTQDLDSRMRQHINELSSTFARPKLSSVYYPKPPLFVFDWNMYGIDQFVVEILEEPRQEILLMREKVWQERLYAIYSSKQDYKKMSKGHCQEEEWININGGMVGVNLIKTLNSFVDEFGHKDRPFTGEGTPMRRFARSVSA